MVTEASRATFEALLRRMCGTSSLSVSAGLGRSTLDATAEPILEPSPDPYLTDWDGDGALTLFDEILRDSATDYAAGVTLAHACVQTDATTVVCEDVLDGHAFLTDDARSTFRATSTFTVIDGRITHWELDSNAPHFAGLIGQKMDVKLHFEYRNWVLATRPAEERELFAGVGDLPDVTPETFERHRQLAAEWLAQR